MTQAAVQKQIKAIEKVTAEALKSKETAKQILIDAGILKEKLPNKKTPKKNK